MDYRDMRGEIGEMMVGMGIALARARSARPSGHFRCCVVPLPAAWLSIEKSIFAKRTQLNNSQSFLHE